MPPKTRFQKEDILQAAFEVVREKGMEGLSTRAVAKRLNCSTMPVYTCLKSRQDLEDSLAARAFEILLDYQTTPRTGDVFIDMGMGYVLFARDEKHLFRCISSEERMERFQVHMEKSLDALADRLAAYPPVSGLRRAEVRHFLMQGWVYAHGLAHLVNTGYYPGMKESSIRSLMEFTGLRYIKGFETLE